MVNRTVNTKPSAVSSVQNKILTLRKQLLSPENSHVVDRAQNSINGISDIVEHLQQLDDEGWEEILESFFREIEKELDEIIQQCRSEIRHQMKNLRSSLKEPEPEWEPGTVPALDVG